MQNIAGTYELIKYGYDYKNNQTFKPISEFYSGMIHYSETGFMSVTLRFAEKPEALDEIVGYCGNYKIEQNKIIHTVLSSVRPEYENQVLVREFKIVDNHLELEFENTADFRKFAIWKKIN